MREGERVGFIGRNGADKTTTLATAMGLADSMSGRISLGGSDIGRASTYLRSRAGLDYVPQSRDIFASLSGAATVARSCRAANSRMTALERGLTAFAGSTSSLRALPELPDRTIGLEKA